MAHFSHNTRNLVISDIFFGLAAILLIVLALMTANLRALIERRAPGETQSLEALADLPPSMGTVIFAGAAQVVIFGETDTRISLDDVLNDPAVAISLSDDPLVVIAPEGGEAAFLVVARAARLGIPALRLIYLDRHCAHVMVDTEAQALECNA